MNAVHHLVMLVANHLVLKKKYVLFLNKIITDSWGLKHKNV